MASIELAHETRGTQALMKQKGGAVRAKPDHCKGGL
jgi:hypothetical protein